MFGHGAAAVQKRCLLRVCVQTSSPKKPSPTASPVSPAAVTHCTIDPRVSTDWVPHKYLWIT